MPISPRFHSEQVRALSLQIERAPEAVRRKQMEAAQELIREIEDDALYPYDYFVYRVTAYRSELQNQPILLGGALLGDVVALVARVSRTLLIPARGMYTVEETAKYLNISTRTLSRLRSEGFVFYWVVEEDGTKRLGCSKQMIDEFTLRNSTRLQQASEFTRLSKAEQNEIVSIAKQYQGQKKYLSQVAAEIAKTSSRGHETIRSLLQQEGELKEEFPQPQRLSRGFARAIEGSIREGVTWVELEQKYKRTPDAMRKAIARLRATRVKQLNISYVAMDMFQRDDAEEVILGSQAAIDVDPPVLVLNSLQFPENETELEETAVVSAMHLLRLRASENITLLTYTAQESLLDRIETDLRWSYLLQQKLIIEAMPSSLAVAVQHVGRPLHELPANKLISLVGHVIKIVGEACGQLDPTKGQTAKRTPSATVDRSIPLLEEFPSATRAAARFKAIEISCPYHSVVPWSNLIPTSNVYEQAKQRSEEVGQAVGFRYGWLGPALTTEEIASRMEKTPLWVARQLHTWA